MKLTKTEEVKLMIIKNFIDYYTSDETERYDMKRSAEDYVEEDHVDEVQIYVDKVLEFKS